MPDLLSEVVQLARKTGQAIKPWFSDVSPEIKSDGSWLTKADTLAHDLLFEKLPEICDVPVLSEELSSIEQQNIIDTAQDGYWCVDPLDGTSNFTQGIPYYCVSIALIDSGEVKLGVVYDPNRDECFHACDDSESCIDGVPIKVTELNCIADATALIEMKRIPNQVATELVLKSPYRSQRSFGASALDLCWVAAGRCQLYLHGEQRLWDYVAAAKILQNAGGKSETFDRKALFQNDLQSKTVIAASTEASMTQWREYFDSVYQVD